MNVSKKESSGSNPDEKIKYKGVRRRKWGKWVSEIRVPGTHERLWLGSYSTPEAAAVAHDVAFYCLRRPPSFDGLNFPSVLPASVVNANTSPKSIQKAASEAGMAIDAHMTVTRSNGNAEVGGPETGAWDWEHICGFGSWEGSGVREAEVPNISVEDYL